MMSLGLLLLAPAAVGALHPEEPSVGRPNVVLIVADDLGYGDLGATGNPWLDTPHLDAMSRAGTWVDPFYVSPVCAPTRAAILTGRYPQRGGVLTNGDALASEAVTIAELLAEAGYATGIFGKWHLGEHFPHRASDQGFEETLVSRGGTLGRLAPQPVEGRYANPSLQHNGTVTEYEGYATEVVFEQCLEWMATQSAAGGSFFAYLPTHVPHRPFHQVPTERYLEILGRLREAELPEGSDVDELARVYSMIEDLDRNVGRLLTRLEELGLRENTLVLFLSDNGANGERYSAGLTGGKGSVHEGGIRAPFFALWPGTLPAGQRIDVVGSHIDVLPTILEACGLGIPTELELDGRSLLPALRAQATRWPERLLYFEAHQGTKYLPFQNFAVRGSRHKLLRSTGYKRKHRPGAEELPELDGATLFDLQTDPMETHDLLAEQPELALSLWRAYVEHVNGFAALDPLSSRRERIRVGHAEEEPLLLTRKNWGRLDSAITGGGGSSGYVEPSWRIRVERPGVYDVLARFPPAPRGARLTLQFTHPKGGDAPRSGAPIDPDSTSHLFEGVQLKAGPYAVEGNVLVKRGQPRPVWQLEIRARDARGPTHGKDD